MAFKTRAQIVASTFNELALVAGSSVQTYTEPFVQEGVQVAFDHLFTKRFWEHLTSTTFHTLDGAGGVVTDTIAGLESISDIKWIRETPFEMHDNIPYFADGVFNTELLAYTGLAYTDVGYDTKRIKFNPTTSVAEIAIRARRKPADFEDDHIVPLDHIMMRHLVTANLLATDGMNPGAEAKHQGLFEDRYDTLVSNEANKPLILQSRRFVREFTVEE
jgi:hypothetical protein